MLNKLKKVFLIRIHLLSPLTVLLFCILGSLFFLLFQGGKLATMLFVIVALVSIYLFLGRWSGIRQAEFNRKITNGSEHLYACQPLHIKIEMKLPGYWPVPYVWMKERLIDHKGEEIPIEMVFVPDWKRNGRVEYEVPNLRRGIYHFANMEAYTEDIFGLFQNREWLKLEQTIYIWPRKIHIHEWKLFQQVIRGMQTAHISSNGSRENTQINGVREYIYGDKFSRIHWNATAKTGAWKSKEFERDAHPQKMIILDRYHKSYEHADDFELAVSITSSILQYGVVQNIDIGFLSIGKRNKLLIEPNKQRLNHKQMERHLLDVECDGIDPLWVVIRGHVNHIPKGSFIPIITTQSSAALFEVLLFLKQQGMIPVHFWITTTHVSEVVREGWLRKLKPKGIHVVPVQRLEELPLLLGGGYK